MPDTHPNDNLVRAWASPDATALRASDNGDGSTMFGHFAVFDQWSEINSAFEGRFLERIAPGAFRDTFKTRGDQIRVLYDHGADPMIGNKPLGSPRILREDKQGAYYEVDLFDSTYVNDLKPAIRAGQLGASFRFQVTEEIWDSTRKQTAENPDGLEMRTITGAKVHEFGPVTFPAYPTATAGMRSRTDEFLEHFLNDPAFVARFRERVGPAVVQQIRASLPPTVETAEPETPTASEETPETPTEPGSDTTSADGGEWEDTHQRRLAMHQRSIAGYVAHIERLKETP